MIQPLFFLVACVAAECAGGGKFSQFVTYHVLGHVYRYEFISVMHRKSVAYKVRRDHGRTAPRLDDVFLAAFLHGCHFLLELNADKWVIF